MEFEKKLKSYQALIESRISTILKNDSPLYIPLRHIFGAGGKRLRPIITLLSAEAVGGNSKKILDTAVAIEFLHTFTLIHDDIMDNSEKRRGLTTIHKKWDNNVAILSGDFLSGLAYWIILRYPCDNIFEILKIFTDAYLKVCEGQNEDMEFSRRKSVKLEDYMNMINKKTAALISASAEIGGLAGGGSKIQVKALREYGLNLGMAFQIKDDLLDVIGKKEFLGKPLYQDIYEAKKTYLLTKANEKASKEFLKYLKRLDGKHKISKEFVNKIKKLYFELGIIDEAEKEVLRFANLAKKKIDILQNTEAKEMLIFLADKITKRNY